MSGRRGNSAQPKFGAGLPSGRPYSASTRRFHAHWSLPFPSRFFRPRSARNGYRRLLNLSGGRGPALNGGNLAINPLDLCQQRVFALGQLNQLPKRRARDVRQHPPLCAEELGLQPPKIAHLGRLTNRRNHSARTNDQATAKREDKQDPDRESR